MAQVTENEQDALGQMVHVEDNDDELDAIAAEFSNTMELDESNTLMGEYNVILGGYSNDIEDEAKYCTVGAGKHNQILDKNLYSAVGGGLNNIVNADYGALVGGWKNKVYSNYGAVIGGFNNKVSARFGAALGGAKNTVEGRFSVAAGYGATTKGDYSATFGFNSSDCVNEEASTIKFCANSFYFNDFDAASLLPSRSRQRRALEEQQRDSDDDDDVAGRRERESRGDDDDDDDAEDVSHERLTAKCGDRLEAVTAHNRRLKKVLEALNSL